jgi:hypothetical protein
MEGVVLLLSIIFSSAILSGAFIFLLNFRSFSAKVVIAVIIGCLVLSGLLYRFFDLRLNVARMRDKKQMNGELLAYGYRQEKRLEEIMRDWSFVRVFITMLLFTLAILFLYKDYILK